MSVVVARTFAPVPNSLLTVGVGKNAYPSPPSVTLIFVTPPSPDSKIKPSLS